MLCVPLTLHVYVDIYYPEPHSDSEVFKLLRFFRCQFNKYELNGTKLSTQCTNCVVRGTCRSNYGDFNAVMTFAKKSDHVRPIVHIMSFF